MSKKATGARACAGAGSRRVRPMTADHALMVSDELRQREEEYLRLNATLEKKASALAQEAQSLMQDGEFLLQGSISTPALLGELQTGDAVGQTSRPTSQHRRRSSSSSRKRPSQAPGSTASARKNPQSAKSKVQPSAPVSLLDEKALIRSTADTDLAEDGLEGVVHHTSEAPAVIPASATEMGSEAAIRFMKAKLQVMQEELERLSSDCVKKDDVVTQLQGHVKAEQDKSARFQKQLQSMQAQEEKHRHATDQLKRKNELLETQLGGLRKDLEALQRTHKQTKVTQSATEVRLNRALEEAERSRLALQKSHSQVKDSTEQDRRRIEELQLENKQLQKQKSELIAAFKKQIKLIDVLKRQKMHMEAAQLLSFSEEEFVKALDWES